MTDISNDPLRFLNPKKKRQSNKQKGVINSINKQSSLQQNSKFILPSFNSQNSLQLQQENKVKKIYNPLKYFSPQIQDYINKLKKLRIANSPIMANNWVSQNSKNKNNGYNQEICRQKQMMSTKNQNLAKIAQENGKKTEYNFNKLGLKKSGSIKMMQRIDKVQNILPNKTQQNGQVTPWGLPQYIQSEPQLKQCEICGRKFNFQSYNKHVKVCDKVFFQKRKPFNSRSKSKQKK